MLGLCPGFTYIGISTSSPSITTFCLPGFRKSWGLVLSVRGKHKKF
jgi:hypothetical protein